MINKPPVSELNPENPRKITADMIIDWAKMLLNPDRPEYRMKQIALHGMKTPGDVALILRSKEGERVKNEILRQMELQKEAQKDIQAQTLRDRLFMHRLRAFLFLLILSKKSKAAHKMMHAIYEQFEKIRKDSEQKNKEVAMAIAAPKLPTLADQLNIDLSAYKEALKGTEEELKDIQAEQAQLEKEAQELAQKLEALDTHYHMLEHHYEDFESHLHELVQNSVEKVTDNIDKLSLAPKIAGAVDDFKVDLNAYKIKTLQNLLCVHHDHNKYFADGIGNQLLTMTNARFILSHDQKIFKKDGKYYLIEAHQDWNTIKESQEALALARMAYKENKRDMLTVKFLLQHDHKKALHGVNDLIERNDSAQLLCQIDRLAALHRQQTIQVAIQDAEQLMQEQLGMAQEEPKQTKPSLSLKPMPQVQDSAKLQPKQVTRVYRDKVQSMKPLTQQRLVDYINGNSFVMSKMKPFLNTPPGTAPLTQQQMRFMIQTLAQFGVNPYKRTLAPSESPLDMTYRPKTPFNINMRPDPYKK